MNKTPWECEVAKLELIPKEERSKVMITEMVLRTVRIIVSVVVSVLIGAAIRAYFIPGGMP